MANSIKGEATSTDYKTQIEFTFIAYSLQSCKMSSRTSVY